MATGYPITWPQIAHWVKTLAGWRCEHCGHVDDSGTHHVLTVHHLDKRPENCEYTNLVALCQKCHLHIQAKFRPGQAFMLDKPRWAQLRGL
jgi:5-methylcytosine-specific restriction endonuclease McrA